MLYPINDKYTLEFLGQHGYTTTANGVYIGNLSHFQRHMEAFLASEEYGDLISEDNASMALDALEELGFEGC